ncbi:hypothetical protein vB_PsyM_KIL4_0159 [Pseudomonas phage vB_PsyM_KIL4]|uniref:Uncharacterized protein n=1 Tax=Pseudomonas phage vB_PsyM_KIL4 TaxID=1777069 RepID=A0A142IF78_9CAUD|nr:hypothetical protein FDI83_gp054 [Pseudomonas phage vB_PsyM_KIL4]AMR57883.1 hypothetical protein vB_PsyM_KIL4_0159 [Pseudomonas phage vB_PsyM_KIL4]
MRRLAIGVNDFLVAVGLIAVILFTFVTVTTLGLLVGLVYGLAAFLLWGVASGLWCVLSGIHNELKKLNEK